MKKKGLVTLGVSLCLVATIGVGATLAYLTDSTNVMTNTFTVGSGISIKLDETKYTNNEIEKDQEGNTVRTEIGNDYGDLQPGDEVQKDPTVTVEADSTDCYVFVKVDGADEVEEADFDVATIDSTDWIKVSGEDNKIDGIYRYKDIIKKNETKDQSMIIFNGVKYNVEADGLAENIPDITIQAAAIQSANISIDQALIEANKFLNPVQ